MEEEFRFAPAAPAAAATTTSSAAALQEDDQTVTGGGKVVVKQEAPGSDVDELAEEDDDDNDQEGLGREQDVSSRAQYQHATAAYQTPLPARAAVTAATSMDGTNAAPSTASSGTQGKRRRRTSPQELQILEEAYKVNALPSSEERIRLSQRTGMSPRAVQIWFQNKRQTEKRRLNQAMYPNVMIIPMTMQQGGGGGVGGSSAAEQQHQASHHPHHHQHPYPTPPHQHYHLPGGVAQPYTPTSMHVGAAVAHPTLQGYLVQPIPRGAAAAAAATYLSPGLTPMHQAPPHASGGHNHYQQQHAHHGPPPPPTFWASQAPSAPPPPSSRPRSAMAQRGPPPSLERRHTASGGFIGGGRDDGAAAANSSDREASSPPARSSSPVPYPRGGEARWTSSELAPLSRTSSNRSDDSGSQRRYGRDINNSDSGRLSVPLGSSAATRPSLERSVSHSATSSAAAAAAFETPSRPKSSLGFRATSSSTHYASNAASAAMGGVPAPRMQIQGGRTKERTLSRGILDEMCSKRELPYPIRKDSRESATGSSSLSDKVSIAALSTEAPTSSSPLGPTTAGDVSFSSNSEASPSSFALVTPVKQVQAGHMAGQFRLKQRSQLWDRMDSDPPSMSPAGAVGNLRERHENSQSGQSSDTDVESDHSPEQAGHLRRIMHPHILCTDADAEEENDEDSAGEAADIVGGGGDRPDKPTLRRLASLDYYAGTPAKRSGSLGAEVRRLGTLQQRLYISKPSQAAGAMMMDEPTSMSDEEEREQQSSGWAARPNLSRSASTSSSRSARSLQQQHLLTPAIEATTTTTAMKDASRLMPDVRDGSGKKDAVGASAGKLRPNEERDEECARLLLGLGMFGSGARA